MARAKVIKRRSAGSASYRTHDDAWYSSVTGKYLPLRDEAGNKIKGKQNEPQAMIAVAHLRMGVVSGQVKPTTEQPPKTKACTIQQVVDVYLDYLKRECAENEYCKGRGVLNSFVKVIGNRAVSELESGDVMKWVAAHHWGPGTIRTYVTTLLSAINHCITHYGKSMGLTANPLKVFKKPTATARVTMISRQQEQWLYEACDSRRSRQPFKQFVRFLIQTGARPQEAARITKSHLRETATGLCAVFPGCASRDGGHKAGKKTGKERVIYLSPEAALLVRTLAKQHPTGPLFRRPRGNAWGNTRLSGQWQRIKREIEKKHGRFVDATTGDELVLYSCRHTFASRCYEAHKDIKLVARLLGNTVEICIKHYVHDDEQTALDYVQSIPSVGGDVFGIRVPNGGLSDSGRIWERS